MIFIYCQDIPQLSCEDILTQEDQLEDLGNPEQVCVHYSSSFPDLAC